MASREKRTLASSKLKQRSNNDSNAPALPATSGNSPSSKKVSPAKSLVSSTVAAKSQSVARDILEAVATGNQLPVKFEASLPRKRALQTALKRKQKSKKTTLSVKVKQKRIAATAPGGKKVKAGAAAKKKKQQTKVPTPTSSVDSGLNTSNESDESKKSKTAKKKGLGRVNTEKFIGRFGFESEARTPKLKRLQKQPKRVKRSLSKEPEEEVVVKQELDQESPALILNIKTEPVNDSYEDTIEEVIQSSMLVANPQVIKEEEGAEPKAGKRLLVRNPIAKRGLRNGRLRRAAEIKTETELDEGKPLVEGMSGTEVENSLDAKPVLGDGIVLKAEEPDDPTIPTVTNHVHDSPMDVETNNNGCESQQQLTEDEIGPKLRSSRTKTRNSDSGCSEIEETKSEVEVKKDKTVVNKFVVNNALSMNSNSVKNRRSSLNLEISRRSSISDKTESLNFDEMINKVKETIQKTIEEQASKAKAAKVSALRKSFETSRRNSVNSPFSDDIRIENGELKVNAIVHTELNPDIKAANDVQNSVPKVADTAKEIEKLVMGDCETAETLPPTDSNKDGEEPTLAPENNVTCGVQLADAKKDEQTSQVEKLDELGISSSGLDELINKVKESISTTIDVDAITKQCEDVKKPGTRKSTRVTAGRSSSAMEIKKPLNSVEVSDELDKSENDKKLKEKSTDSKTFESKTETTVSLKKVKEEVKENKTAPIPVEAPSESFELTTKPKTEKVETSLENCQADETLESLSRDIEMLVEADNEKSGIETLEHESSDIEMQLMIDEDLPVPVSEKTEQAHLNDGCDAKISEKVDETISTEPSEKLSVVPTEVNEDKSSTDTQILNDQSQETTAKNESDTTTDEVEVKKAIKRSVRGRGKQKKVESNKPPSIIITSVPKNKSEEKAVKSSDEPVTPEVPSVTKSSEDVIENSSQAIPNEPTEIISEPADEPPPEPQIRTRRTRVAKRSLTLIQHPIKAKRGKKAELKKPEGPQNKEETLLDNEVAEINENNRSKAFLKSESKARGVSENPQKLDVPDTKNRSKSENDVLSNSREIVKSEDESVKSNLDEKVKSNLDESVKDASKEESKDNEPKDTDEASVSSESSGNIQESAEEKAKKKDILRVLGLESWDDFHARKQKEQEQSSTGSLKTVIRLKEKDKKKRSRSPLKLVIKQQPGRQVEGEENLDFYIQKEDVPSCSGESSSGANRELSTNPRHSCEEDEDNPSSVKDRQSLVIPEKSSSFSIHPGRLCSDTCCHCYGKFGSLDTPMHLAQMKSEERKQKILDKMIHLTKDSCLCDACYRHVDRKVNASPTTQLKPQRQSRQSMYPCSVVNCSEAARHHLKRRCFYKIKANMKNLDVNWESGQHNLLAFCDTHYAPIEQILTCTLCHKRLTKNLSHPLGLSPIATEQLNQRLRSYSIPSSMVYNMFVCKLCKFFTKIHLKFEGVENMSEANREFHKGYTKKLIDSNGREEKVLDSEEEPEFNHQAAKSEDSKNTSTTASLSASITKKSKSVNSLEKSDKSRPETPKTDSGINVKQDSRFMGIEGAIEKLKKRKAIDTDTPPSVSILKNNAKDGTKNARDVVDILALDKEVTLTRLSKRPRLENSTTTFHSDITPVVQRLGANPSISVRTLFPGEEEMNLQANVEFSNVREITPQGWEKCATMIQYDKDTKMLWQELQRPYGNQSSFLRHLILLEKYYRAGDLILAPNASRNAINYSTSVQNRLISYNGPERGAVEEPIVEISTVTEFNSRRGNYSLDSNRSMNTSTTLNTSSSLANITAQLSKLDGDAKVMKLTPGVSIVKKNPPNLHRLNTSNTSLNGSAKRKESTPVQKFSGGSGASGKVFQLSEPDFKRLQNLKRQKNERQSSSPHSAAGGSNPNQSSSHPKVQSLAQYKKAQQEQAQIAQFQKHLLMQQEMYNQRSRSDFEPLICSLANENTPTQNILSTINLPKSIQITTKGPVATSSPIPILPKIPKSLTVIPQTVSREK